MGEVYLAEDTRLNRKVALKILPAALSNDSKSLYRFQREALAASALNHPNILTVYEFGKEGSLNFLATEFVEGQNLREKLKSEGVNFNDALDIAQQIAFALSAAHAAGIVHRDIKPENVMLRTDGIAKVLDFGLAKLIEQNPLSPDSQAETQAQVKTQAGTVLGTVPYMSPEQASGTNVDARTDIWSLGVVLYEMLAGQLPFTGKTINHLIVSILEREPAPLGKFVKNVPAEIERIVTKALIKQLDERYQTARDLMIDLKNLRRKLDLQIEMERSDSTNFLNTVSKSENMATEAFTQENVVSTKNTTTQTISKESIADKVKFSKSAFAIALVAIMLLAFGVLAYRQFSNRSASSTNIESIAVMPFVNESDNTDNEYLSDGITETLISSLSQLPKLSVRGRGSVFRYKGKDVNIRQLGNELSVQAILNGRVVRRGDDIRLYVELIDVVTDKVLWSKPYNRQMTNLLLLQTEIARDVSNNLQMKLSGADEQKLARNYTANSEAYQLYWQGRFYLNSRANESLINEHLKRANNYFQLAIAKDPNYALAYAGLADCYVLSGSYNVVSPNEAVSKAKAAAMKAIELDDRIAEPHATLATIKYSYDWNFADADADFKNAIEINPNYPTARQWYGEYLAVVGRLDEALVQMKRAQELEPLQPIINRELGVILMFKGDYDQAVNQFLKTLEIDSNSPEVRSELGLAYTQKRMYQEAILEHEKALVINEKSAYVLSNLAYTYAMSGKTAEAQKILKQLQEVFAKNPASATELASAYAVLGEKDKAFEFLEKSYKNHINNLLWFRLHPPLASLRSDPRFTDLARRIGLPQ